MVHIQTKETRVRQINKKLLACFTGAGFLLVALLSSYTTGTHYRNYYFSSFDSLDKQLSLLSRLSRTADLEKDAGRGAVKAAISNCRFKLKACDFWLRYIEPNAYRRINGPLPVEWETEVFEKYEPPYKREGAGLSLAFLYLETKEVQKDSLLGLVNAATEALRVYSTDSVAALLNSHDEFYLCNRLYLLNLATIYTTGFECPDTKQIIPELKGMMQSVAAIYSVFNNDYPGYALDKSYLQLYSDAMAFVNRQPLDYKQFNHFSFIRDYVNPLFRMNQQLIQQYKVRSKSQMDYTLNDKANAIFDKALFKAQDSKGIYYKISDPAVLAEIDSIGKLLFYDPVLSGNNRRSCANCHKPGNDFADTSLSTPVEFNHSGSLARNAPSLVNVVYNHLLQTDGKFLTLQEQAKAVMTNPAEMNGNEEEIVQKVLSCNGYKKYLDKFAAYTNESKPSLNHIISAITYYYGQFSNYYSPFDAAMNSGQAIDKEAVAGFNVFMGKAQCGTCHFAPLFNGIKPPYINNEFEVLGVPQDTFFKAISSDSGRYKIHAAPETQNAFRTPTIRNTALTKSYMHNAVFKTLDEVIDFYDAGGGAGKGLAVNNQTLSSDSLHLSATEKKQLVAFINSLNESVKFDTAPQQLPASKNKKLNGRKSGGDY